MNEDALDQNEALWRAYPALDATNVDKAAVRGRVAGRVKQVRRARFARRAVLSAALTCILATAAVLLGPKALAAYRLAQIRNSVSDIATAELDFYSVLANGNLKPGGHVLFERDKMRFESGKLIEIVRGDTAWRYDADQNEVFREPGDAAQRFQLFLRSITAEGIQPGFSGQIETGAERYEGKLVDKVTVTEVNGRDRTIILADPSTHLPILRRSEAHVREGFMNVVWQPQAVIRFSFNKSIDPKMFAIDFPRNAKAVDLTAAQNYWRARFAKKLAILTVQRHEFTIRDLTMNPRGDVFVLYTDGTTEAEAEKQAEEDAKWASKAFKNWDGEAIAARDQTPQPYLELASAHGSKYAMATLPIIPYDVAFRDESEKRSPTGIALADGEVLKASWFVPMDSQDGNARKLELAIHLIPSDRKGTIWTPRHVKSTSTDLPDWNPVMASGLHGEEELLGGERNARENEGQMEGRWHIVEMNIRDDIAAALREDGGRPNYDLARTYRSLANALQNEGKEKEADQAMKLADQQPEYARH